MELWTEYEGRTIDGGIALNKLVAPQGRSAFFSTANAKGEPTLIRLVACHFDEEEILARWRGVQALNHPNFLKLEQYGQLTLDETKVVYAVFEHADANLAQVLSQGRLSAPDVTQLASTLASAVEMLHINGFIHEHLEPENVFAVGEVVKVRTDCIRETPEGAEGLEAKRRDVRDLAIVLLQALTQERTVEAATRRRPLPAPFDQIVPRALSGEWGLTEILAATRPLQSKAAPSASASAAPPRASAPPSRPALPPSPSPAARPVPPGRANAPEPKQTRPVAPSVLSHVRDEDRPLDAMRRNKWIPVAALVGLLLLWIGWIAFHHDSKRGVTAKQTPAAKSAARPAEPRDAAPVARTATAGAATAPRPNNTSVAGGHEQWRVVAYTYSRQSDAQKRSAAIGRKHPDLHPAVFSPTGHAPYLVTIGGAMSREQAYALAHRSRRLGFPRDTYAQNYTGR